MDVRIHAVRLSDPDVSIVFLNAPTAVQLMTAPNDQMKQIHAMKNFLVEVEGPDAHVIWLMRTLNMLQQIPFYPAYGVPLENGEIRYTNNKAATSGSGPQITVKRSMSLFLST